MTWVARYSPADWKFDADRFIVNGTHSFDVYACEVRHADNFQRLVVNRLMPLIWLGMPVHDRPTEADDGADNRPA